MGRGISLNKIDYLNARDSHVQKLEASQSEMLIKIEELHNQVRCLAGKNLMFQTQTKEELSVRYWIGVRQKMFLSGKENSARLNHNIWPDAFVWRPTTTVFSISQTVGVKIPWPADKVVLDSESSSLSGYKPRDSDEAQMKCNIFAWNGSEIVAEGIIYSVEPTEKVNQIPLGPNAAIIKVQNVIDHEAFLWRPSSEMALMGDALNENIAWPLDKVAFCTSPESTSKSIGSSKSAKKKCILFDCSGSGKIVSEGRVCFTGPDDRVHFIPLGPNASKVWVDLSKIGDANVLRPNSEVECVADAIGTTIAWPNDKLKVL